MPQKKCKNCNYLFEYRKKDQQYCKKTECTKIKNKLWRKNSHNIKKKPKKCICCSKTYMPLHINQKTCGSEECKRYLKKDQRRKEEKEYNCKICNELSWSSNPEAILCGKDECRKQYVYEFNAKNKYKKKLRKKVKSLAKKKGKFSQKEIYKIIKLRLSGKSYTDIAISLKRTLNSIDVKCRSIFRSEDYQEIIENCKEQLMISEYENATKEKRLELWNRRIKQIFKEN